MQIQSTLKLKRTLVKGVRGKNYFRYYLGGRPISKESYKQMIAANKAVEGIPSERGYTFSECKPIPSFRGYTFSECEPIPSERGYIFRKDFAEMLALADKAELPSDDEKEPIPSEEEYTFSEPYDGSIKSLKVFMNKRLIAESTYDGSKSSRTMMSLKDFMNSLQSVTGQPISSLSRAVSVYITKSHDSQPHDSQPHDSQRIKFSDLQQNEFGNFCIKNTDLVVSKLISRVIGVQAKNGEVVDTQTVLTPSTPIRTLTPCRHVVRKFKDGVSCGQCPFGNRCSFLHGKFAYIPKRGALTILSGCNYTM